MQILHILLLIAHMVGMVALIGAWLASRSRDWALPTMLWAARFQLITGLLLLATLLIEGEGVNWMKYLLKFLIALGVAGLVEAGTVRKKTQRPYYPLFDFAGALALVNVAVAFFWH